MVHEATRGGCYCDEAEYGRTLSCSSACMRAAIRLTNKSSCAGTGARVGSCVGAKAGSC